MASEKAHPAYTYRDPTLSLWQSAVAVTTWKSADEESIRPRQTFMDPVHIVAAEALGTAPIQPGLESAAVAGDCAAVAAKFLWAEVRGNKQDADRYAGELKKAVCDAAGWSTCVSNYLKFKAEAGHFPYIEGKDQVVDYSKDPVRIALIGDWGTGEAPAKTLLKEIKAQGPDILVHLGDIYYSGTRQEAKNNFLDICRTTLGNTLPLFTLCGNHDMYSGGEGYYWLLGQIHQQASYFAIRTPHWQLLAMDTGHNDCNPITVSSNMTSLNPQEVNWLLAKVNSAESRKTILLSHHQLFSAFSAVGQGNGRGHAYNPNLYGCFRNILDRIIWWFWGHEHTLAAYTPYMGLQRGRCIGCSAVPVFVNQQSYSLDRTLLTLEGQYPAWIPNLELGNNGTDYNHAFAMLELSHATARVDYFQAPVNGPASLLWRETYP